MKLTPAPYTLANYPEQHADVAVLSPTDINELAAGIGESDDLRLRQFLTDAFARIKANRLANQATLTISAPIPLSEVEAATGLVFPEVLKSSPFIFTDTETTGTDPTVDKIIELGMVKIANGYMTEFSTLINPGIPIPPELSAVHHITNEMVKDAPTEDEVRGPAQEFIGEAMLVAHNAKFDASFVNPFLERTYDGSKAGTDNWLCTLRLARLLMPDSAKHNNQFLHYYFATTPKSAGLGAHRAIDDSHMSMESLKALVYVAEDMGIKFNTLAEIKEFADRVIPYTHMAYGKHGPDPDAGREKGLALTDVPIDYFDWMLGNDKNVNPSSKKYNWDMHSSIKAEVERRGNNVKLGSRMANSAPKPTGEPLQVVDFGKHSGQKVSEVPDKYIDWALRDARLSEGMRKGFELEVARRKNPAPTAAPQSEAVNQSADPEPARRRPKP